MMLKHKSYFHLNGEATVQQIYDDFFKKPEQENVIGFFLYYIFIVIPHQIFEYGIAERSFKSVACTRTERACILAKNFENTDYLQT